VTVTYDRSNVRFYVNGVLEGSPAQTSAIATNTVDFYIGNSPAVNRGFDGFIDEVRISNPVRSARWIQTEYNNQNDSSIFYTLSSEEIFVGNNPCNIQNESPEDGLVDIQFNPILEAIISDANGDSVYWEIRTNASSTWQTLNSSTLAGGNGTISAATINMNSYNTRYWWSVNATDTTGSGIWTNETYSLTTISPSASTSAASGI